MKILVIALALFAGMTLAQAQEASTETTGEGTTVEVKADNGETACESKKGCCKGKKAKAKKGCCSKEGKGCCKGKKAKAKKGCCGSTEAETETETETK